MKYVAVERTHLEALKTAATERIDTTSSTNQVHTYVATKMRWTNLAQGKAKMEEVASSNMFSQDDAHFFTAHISLKLRRY